MLDSRISLSETSGPALPIGTRSVARYSHAYRWLPGVSRHVAPGVAQLDVCPVQDRAAQLEPMSLAVVVRPSRPCPVVGASEERQEGRLGFLELRASVTGVEGRLNGAQLDHITRFSPEVKAQQMAAALRLAGADVIELVAAPDIGREGWLRRE